MADLYRMARNSDIVARFNEGQTTKRIARDVGLSPNTVRMILRDAGVPRPRETGLTIQVTIRSDLMAAIDAYAGQHKLLRPAAIRALVRMGLSTPPNDGG